MFWTWSKHIKSSVDLEENAIVVQETWEGMDMNNEKWGCDRPVRILETMRTLIIKSGV